MEPILQKLLLNTLRQLCGFNGITGYREIWIPRYEELPRPLYKLLKDTEQSGPKVLQWEPGEIHAFKTFSLPSVHFSSVTQSCPTLCDPMDSSTQSLPVHHQVPEFT